MRSIAYMLMGVVAVAQVAGPIGYAHLTGDTNGDRKVDILDVQRVLGEVLSDAEGTQATDVNDDGKIDLLDFQSTLFIASSATTPTNDPTPEDDSGEATVLKAAPDLNQYFVLNQLRPTEYK